jgi:hypothetical protein
MLVFTKKNYEIEKGSLLENKTFVGFSYFDLFNTHLIHLQSFDITLLSISYSLNGIKIKIFDFPKEKKQSNIGISFALLNIPIINLCKRKYFFDGKMVSQTYSFSLLGFNLIRHTSVLKSKIAPAVMFDSFAYEKEMNAEFPEIDSPEEIRKKLKKYKKEFGELSKEDKERLNAILKELNEKIH